ncbi:MAG: nucleotide exchange factor GrpE [Lachnospiraceae bacterium]|nr:nucleotide exchange factor GrpE [Lachnospiraceae bacterium]
MAEMNKEEKLDNQQNMTEEASEDKDNKADTEAKAEDNCENAEAEVNKNSEAAETDEEESAKEPAGEDEESGKKGKWKKNDKKLDALKQKNEELEDRVKRQMAEFENFRKRTEKEKSTMFEMGAKSVIEKLLPVVDNFERGLATASDDDKQDPIYEGMNLIYKQLVDELDKLGVKPIEALGEEFNPEFHNAVMQEDSDEFEEGIVCKELQKGYTYRDSVVRHSMVAVAK